MVFFGFNGYTLVIDSLEQKFSSFWKVLDDHFVGNAL